MSASPERGASPPVLASPPASWAGRRAGIGTALLRVVLALALAFGGLAAGAGYWQVIRSSELSGAPNDAAVVAAARRVLRGEISDRDGERLAWNKRDANGEPYRVYASASLSGVIGYASRRFDKAGLERQWDAQLSGVVSADPLRDFMRKFQADPSDPQDLRTSLVLRLQDAAVAALGRNHGAIVMLDPRTGEVLVLASTPTFDASEITNPETAEAAFRRVNEDERRPLLPRATQGRYVPGSVFKIVTAAAALGSGAVTPGTSFEEQPEAEERGLLVDGFRVRDGHHRATGERPLEFAEAVEASCNIWFALAGLRTGGDELAASAARFGFGERIPFDVPTAASQVSGDGGAGIGGGFADRVELANAAYGQAETLATPLQMALVAAAVANDGVLMQPHIVISATGKGGTTTINPSVWRQVMAPGVASEIAAAMRQAVGGEIGQAFTPGADVRGLQVAGKSGTAELEAGRSPHSWFIGFAPYDDPEVAFAVIVEESGGGEVKASRLAGEMLREWRAWSRP